MQSFSCSAILFDLDGVLVDSISSVERAWRKFAERHKLDPAEVLRAAHGHRSLETVRMLMPNLDAEVENRIVEQDEIDDAVGLTATEGAAELLTVLPPERWTIVTSGTRPLATARLRAAGLPIPRHLVAADEVVNGKPHPEPYIKGAVSLGFRPAQCIVFEDAPTGIRSALSAGAKVIGIPGTYDGTQLQSAGALVGSLAHVSVEINKDGLTVRIPEFTRVTAQ
jgi:mannitol-1-/sugar-/sorbitol-6-phosphatase